MPNAINKTWADFVGEAEAVVRQLGLDPKPTIFEEVRQRELHRIIAQGVPWAPPHWTRGRDAMASDSEYERGAGQVYEVVFDMGDHAIAYISSGSSQAERTLTVPHVFGHSHVFAHNVFQPWVGDLWAKYRQAYKRYAAYEEVHGYEAIEEWIDLAQALSYNVSPDEPPDYSGGDDAGYYDPHDVKGVPLDYRPPRDRSRSARINQSLRALGIGEHDILRWIIRHAPLEDWQRDILSIERDIALYWNQRAKTKILHEGFATWAHIRALRNMRLPAEWAIEAAALHARISRASVRNPYWFGLQAILYMEEALGAEAMIDKVRTLSDHSLIYGLLDEPGWYHRLYEESQGGYLLWGDDILYEDFVAQMRRFLTERLLPSIVGDSFRVYVGDPDELIKLGVIPKRSYASLAIYSGSAHMELCLTSEVPLDVAYARRVGEMINAATGLMVRIYHPM